MSVTLEPTTALVVIDMQKGILAMSPAELSAPVIDRVNALADAFHDAGLPVVWVNATGLPAGRVTRPIPEPADLPADFTELHDAMHVADADHRVAKQRTISPFPKTDLAEFLRARGATGVVLCGIATGAGVELAARSAWDEGFNVVVASDACADGNRERHEFSLTTVLPGVGLVGTADEVIAALATR